MYGVTALRFLASDTPPAQDALRHCVDTYGQARSEDADLLVVLGGDGYMLTVLADQLTAGGTLPVYGVNYGTVGFLMNRALTGDPGRLNLIERISAADPVTLTPLRVEAYTGDGCIEIRWAFNEIALRREGSQAAHLAVAVDGRQRLADLAGDGLLLATPAGSAAYNYSAGGPVLPLSARALALTAICPISPRRWPGAVLPAEAQVSIDVLQPDKRPVILSADTSETVDVRRVTICQDPAKSVTALYDSGHDLDERLLALQFAH